MTTVSDLIRRKRLSSAELTEMALRRIAQLDGQYHSYVTVLPERALTSESGGRGNSRGLWRGPLHGVPVAVEDLLLHNLRSDLRRDHNFQDFHSVLQRHRC